MSRAAAMVLRDQAYRRIAALCRFTETPLNLVVGYRAIPASAFSPQEWRDLLGFEGDDS